MLGICVNTYVLYYLELFNNIIASSAVKVDNYLWQKFEKIVYVNIV